MAVKPKHDPMFSVGETVTVVGAKTCAFGWAAEMLDYIGKPVTIQKRDWADWRNCWVYYIKEDYGCWSWSDSCFQKQPDFEVQSTNAIFDFLMKG